MRIETRETEVKTLAQRWRQQYPNDGPRDWTIQKQTQLYKLARGGVKNADAIDKLIGNESWMHKVCDECSEYVERVVTFGLSPTSSLCEKCLKDAVRLIGKQRTATRRHQRKKL